MRFVYKKTIVLLLSLFCVTAIFGCSSSKNTFAPSKEINVITREEGSGTRDAFTELTGVLVKNNNGNRKDNTTVSAVTINSTEAVLTNVSNDRNSIGYVSLGSLRNSVKALKIDGIACNAKNIKNGCYAISRPFIIATKNNVREVVSDFIGYILSSDGQFVVEKEGYVTVTNNPKYSSNKPQGKVSVAGSSSVAPVMEKLKEAYEIVNPNATVEIQASDSSTGMTATMEGACDVGMASRELKAEETSLNSIEIAKDGIAVVVNPENTINNISFETVRKIYTGEYKRWEQVII